MNIYGNQFITRTPKIKLILLVVGLTTLLTGCNDLNSKFTCPLQPGVNCQSLDQVNTLVDQGKLSENSSETPIPSSKSPMKIATVTQPLTWTEVSSISDFKQAPQRLPETVIRIWIAPYLDQQGNYYSATLVYHVIPPSHWSSEDANAIQKGAHHA